MIKAFHSEDYQCYKTSCVPCLSSVVKIMRLGISLLVLYQAAYSCYSSYSNSKMLIFFILLVVNLSISTFVLDARYRRFSWFYMFVIIHLYFAGSLETAIMDGDEQLGDPMKISFFLGFAQGLVLLSKLPGLYVICSFLLLSVYHFARLYCSGLSLPFELTTLLLYLFFVLILVFSCVKNEFNEFLRWTALQNKTHDLWNYEQLIQTFPAQIIIVNKKSWEKKEAVYMNDKAQEQYEEVISLESIFDFFKLDLDVKENFHDGTFITETLKSFTEKRMNEEILAYDLKDTSRRFFSGYFEKTEESLPHHKASEKNIFISRNQVTTKTSLSNVIDDRLNEEQKSLANEGAGRVKYRYEVRILSVFWKNEGALMYIFTDVSFRQRIDQLKALDENKDRLLATVSHELRSPLNGMIGLIDILDEMVEGPKIKKYVATMRNTANSLLLLINDILDLSQVIKGVLRIKMEPVPLLEVIDNVVPLIEVQTKKKGVQFVLSNLCAAPPVVLADRIRLQQILLNLLSNACKFTEKGSVTLSVSKVRSQQPEEKSFHNAQFENLLFDAREEILISVEDTGRGIRQENLSSLFTLFGKFEHKDNPTGVGLGLNISQILATRMHPHGITVESAIGKGTKFSFLLWAGADHRGGEAPFKADGGDQAAERAGAFKNEAAFKNENKDGPAPKGRDLPGKFILIVDDDHVNQLALKKYLEKLPETTFETAFNGLQAIERVKKAASNGTPFNLILMDCNMPIMDGFEACKELSVLMDKGEVPVTPMVALTGGNFKGQQESLLLTGFKQVWAKPIFKDEFLKKISEIFDGI